ncbi:MAG: hypothetical protein H6738_13355 [Alphaproteobacteria bacterium]|nr:hypothetical protein [Alphaproteobacteria bacterium]MCB9697764.1 hypothetical protein [Alphaproteobacteria bacterium]
MIAWLIGCTGNVDPELQAARTSLDAWERGVALLEEHDAAGARVAFAEARAAREDPLLVAWMAAAAAEDGDLAAADALYAEALEAAPDLASARYRHGIVLARLGDHARAAIELQRAIDDGAARTLELLEDPELAPHLDQPAYDFVPRQAVTVAVERVPETAFWGSEVSVGMRLLGLVRPPFSVVDAPVEGPVELVSVLEEDLSTSQGPGLAVRFLLRVTGAGKVVVGPTTYAAGTFRAIGDLVTFEAAAPPGREEAPRTSVRLRLPDEWLARVPDPGAALVDGQLVVSADPTDRITVTPTPASPPVTYERRFVDRPPSRVSVWTGGGGTSGVKVVARDGTVRFDGPPAGG